MAVIDDFKARFTEFDVAIVDIFIPIFEPLIECYFIGGYTGCDKEITLQLLAHLIAREIQSTVGGSTGASGSPLRVEASLSVGSVSQSFEKSLPANHSELKMFMATTRYGQSFLMLISHRGGGIAV